MNPNQIAKIGSLIGEPARAAMLMALMDGQALTANELARCANITPQTASSHLSQLVLAGLMKFEKQGRHRYHRIATPETARLIESMMQIASADLAPIRSVVTGPRDEAMRLARTCYDHLAGNLGVAIADSLLNSGYVAFERDVGTVTDAGVVHLRRAGIELSHNQPGRSRSTRPVCRPCLDWSVRRPHIAGALGAAICSYFMDHRLAVRIKGSRALTVTPRGEQVLFEVFGIRSLD